MEIFCEAYHDQRQQREGGHSGDLSMAVSYGNSHNRRKLSSKQAWCAAFQPYQRAIPANSKHLIAIRA
jgi:hypothetical protein